MNFHNICDEFLLRLAEKIEAQDKNFVLDVEYSEGILEIEITPKKGTFVINRNSGNQKIWYSSPFSGADYFSFEEETVSQNFPKCLNSKGEELENKLFSELPIANSLK